MTKKTKINGNDLEWTSNGDGSSTAGLFASDLHLPPGQFPKMIHVSPKVGNGQFFWKSNNLEDGGVEYTQGFGILKINVYND